MSRIVFYAELHKTFFKYFLFNFYLYFKTMFIGTSYFFNAVTFTIIYILKKKCPFLPKDNKLKINFDKDFFLLFQEISEQADSKYLINSFTWMPLKKFAICFNENITKHLKKNM